MHHFCKALDNCMAAWQRITTSFCHVRNIFILLFLPFPGSEDWGWALDPSSSQHTPSNTSSRSQAHASAPPRSQLPAISPQAPTARVSVAAAAAAAVSARSQEWLPVTSPAASPSSSSSSSAAAAAIGAPSADVVVDPAARSATVAGFHPSLADAVGFREGSSGSNRGLRSLLEVLPVVEGYASNRSSSLAGSGSDSGSQDSTDYTSAAAPAAAAGSIDAMYAGLPSPAATGVGVDSVNLLWQGWEEVQESAAEGEKDLESKWLEGSEVNEEGNGVVVMAACGSGEEEAWVSVEEEWRAGASAAPATGAGTAAAAGAAAAAALSVREYITQDRMQLQGGGYPNPQQQQQQGEKGSMPNELVRREVAEQAAFFGAEGAPQHLLLSLGQMPQAVFSATAAAGTNSKAPTTSTISSTGSSGSSTVLASASGSMSRAATATAVMVVDGAPAAPIACSTSSSRATSCRTSPLPSELLLLLQAAQVVQQLQPGYTGTMLQLRRWMCTPGEILQKQQQEWQQPQPEMREEQGEAGVGVQGQTKQLEQEQKCLGAGAQGLSQCSQQQQQQERQGGALKALAGQMQSFQKLLEPLRQQAAGQTSAAAAPAVPRATGRGGGRGGAAHDAITTAYPTRNEVMSSGCNPGVRQVLCQLSRKLAAVQQLGQMGELWAAWIRELDSCWVSRSRGVGFWAGFWHAM